MTGAGVAAADVLDESEADAPVLLGVVESLLVESSALDVDALLLELDGAVAIAVLADGLFFAEARAGSRPAAIWT